MKKVDLLYKLLQLEEGKLLAIRDIVLAVVPEVSEKSEKTDEVEPLPVLEVQIKAKPEPVVEETEQEKLERELTEHFASLKTKPEVTTFVKYKVHYYDQNNMFRNRVIRVRDDENIMDVAAKYITKETGMKDVPFKVWTMTGKVVAVKKVK